MRTATFARFVTLFNRYLLGRPCGLHAPFSDRFIRLEEHVANGEEVDQPHQELQEIRPGVLADQVSKELP